MDDFLDVTANADALAEVDVVLNGPQDGVSFDSEEVGDLGPVEMLELHHVHSALIGGIHVDDQIYRAKRIPARVCKQGEVGAPLMIDRGGRSRAKEQR